MTTTALERKVVSLAFPMDVERWGLYRLLIGISRPSQCPWSERHGIVGMRCFCGFIRLSPRRVRWL